MNEFFKNDLAEELVDHFLISNGVTEISESGYQVFKIFFESLDEETKKKIKEDGEAAPASAPAAPINTTDGIPKGPVIKRPMVKKQIVEKKEKKNTKYNKYVIFHNMIGHREES